MKRFALSTLVVSLGVALAPFAHAAEEEHVDPTLLLFHAFGLIVLGSVIVYFARTPLQNFLKDRSDVLRRELEAARSALEAARSANQQMKARLARIGEEHEALMRDSAEIAERESARALERARAAAERVRQEAHRAADHEIERARGELQSEAARLATKLAGEMLRQNLTPDDERRLLGEFVARVGRPS
jgi:F-type H+-transporting ATPase subunit b